MPRMMFIAALLSLAGNAFAGSVQQSRPAPDTTVFTHADTLRGSITPGRAWWDVTFYDLHVRINPADSSISGYNLISYRVIKRGPAYTGRNGKAVTAATSMQIDLMTPLVVDSMVQDGRSLRFRRDGNAFFVAVPGSPVPGSSARLAVYYHGKPRVAKNPPWDGGFIWSHDRDGNCWIATACQGVGASIWWPNKDIQADEPDSQRIAITVPDTLMEVSNGRLRKKTVHPDGTATYEWFVDNPINNYDVAVNAGKYVHFGDTYQGEKGPLTLDYYVLPYHLQAAKKQFQQVKRMLQCFEYWFGPYPWYKDGYKLVEAPYLGMEHQSCIGYGNGFQNGYRGTDLSHTGLGLKWDFIIVHESAHEWFGNNITSKDIADMWVHESFANYAESLYTECLFGKKAGEEYCIGTRSNVINDRPVIGHYGVNEEGSEDMYYKGGNMLLTIREIIGDDARFRAILRGLNSAFSRQTVTGKQIEDYISEKSGIDLSKVFQQYLTTTRIPEFEYYIRRNLLHYRWNNVIPDFDMPLKVTLSGDSLSVIHPTESWQTMPAPSPSNFKVDKAFYVIVRKVK